MKHTKRGVGNATPARAGGRAAADWEPFVLPLGVGFMFLAPVFARDASAPAGILLVAWIAAAVALVFAAARPLAGTVSRDVRIAGGALALFVGALALSTLRAESPTIALLGGLGQRLGAAFWLVCVVWVWLGFRFSSRRTLRYVMWVTSAGPALYGLSALLEAVSGSARSWGSAAGLLENSLTLGSLLVLGSASSIALAMSERSLPRRALAIAMVAACGAGLFVAESRGAFAGAVAAAAFVLCYRLSRTRRSRLALGISVPAVAAFFTAAVAMAAAGAFGSGVFSALNALGNDRLITWKAAADAASRDWLLGRGMEHFTAILSFGYVRERVMGFESAFDPHNALLALLIGGGVIAAATALVAAGALLVSALESLSLAGSPLGPGVLLAGVVGVGAAALFAWPGQLAFVSAAALIGCLIRVGQARSPERPPGTSARLLPVGLAAVSVVVALAVFAAFRSDARFARLTPEERFQSASLEQVVAASPSGMVDARLFQAWLAERPGEAVPADLMARIEAAAAWRVDAAFALVTSALVRNGSDIGTGWTDIEAAADRARVADGSTPLWDYWLATVAAGEGLKEPARTHAEAALAKDPDPEKAAELERILSE